MPRTLQIEQCRMLIVIPRIKKKNKPWSTSILRVKVIKFLIERKIFFPNANVIRAHSILNFEHHITVVIMKSSVWEIVIFGFFCQMQRNAQQKLYVISIQCIHCVVSSNHSALHFASWNHFANLYCFSICANFCMAICEIFSRTCSQTLQKYYTCGRSASLRHSYAIFCFTVRSYCRAPILIILEWMKVIIKEQ